MIFTIHFGGFPPIFGNTHIGTNISPQNGIFEDDFPFPEVGYVSSLEGSCLCCFHDIGNSWAKHVR